MKPTRNRAVSTVVSYGLILGIVTLLVAALFISIGDFTRDQREQTTRSSLIVVGTGIASDLETVDRLAIRSGQSGNVSLTAHPPGQVAGSLYDIEITEVAGDGRYEITLRSFNPKVSATVEARTSVPIEPVTVDGGNVEIIFDATRGTIEVDDA